MQIIAFKVKLNEVFSEPKLLKGGWMVRKKDIQYIKIKGDFTYFYNILRIGKIAMADITCIINNDGEAFEYSTLKEFDFEKGWNNLWSASFIPSSVEMMMKENILDSLINIGFKPCVSGVIEYKKEYKGEVCDVSFYYPAPEGNNLYKLVDDNPLDCMDFISKLCNIGIISQERSSRTFSKETTMKSVQKATSTGIISIGDSNFLDLEECAECMSLYKFNAATFEGMEKYSPEGIEECILGTIILDEESGCAIFKPLNYNGKYIKEKLD